MYINCQFGIWGLEIILNFKGHFSRICTLKIKKRKWWCLTRQLVWCVRCLQSSAQTPKHRRPTHVFICKHWHNVRKLAQSVRICFYEIPRFDWFERTVWQFRKHVCWSGDNEMSLAYIWHHKPSFYFSHRLKDLTSQRTGDMTNYMKEMWYEVVQSHSLV